MFNDTYPLKQKPILQKGGNDSIKIEGIRSNAGMPFTIFYFEYFLI
jgi:hypothetical protein